MKLYQNPGRDQWEALCARPGMDLDFLTSTVRDVMEQVRTGKDAALRKLTAQFDQVNLSAIAVTQAEVDQAHTLVPDKLKAAMQVAATNIEKFHAAQKADSRPVETSPGVKCWRVATPIEKVGLYIPGGSAPLFSTALMLGIPARIARCQEVVMCTPPNKDGTVNAAILFAAHLAGIEKIYKVGGSQAIAAMAFGTETVLKVDKLFGPGNQYVTKAKEIANQMGIPIDIPAGPSEVLVLADDSANPLFVAADLLSQAEHGSDSQVVLVTDTENTARHIQEHIEKLTPTLPRAETIRGALQHSHFIVLPNRNDQVDFINQYAPEHLIINTADCDEVCREIRHAGSVFLGNYTPESAGDYASGTNHTLPTAGHARTYGGVSLESYMKYISVQKITRPGLEGLGPTLVAMAEAEKLAAHAQAVRVRIEP